MSDYYVNELLDDLAEAIVTQPDRGVRDRTHAATSSIDRVASVDKVNGRPCRAAARAMSSSPPGLARR
jgi:hypothetical protein